MTWFAKKMIMFCIFRDVRDCKEAEDSGAGGDVFFLDKQKNPWENNILVSLLPSTPPYPNLHMPI
jgi:hypothetical protein